MKLLSDYIIEASKYLLYTVKVGSYKDDLRIDIEYHYFDQKEYAFMNDNGRVYSYSDEAAESVNNTLLKMEEMIKGFDSREIKENTIYKVYSDGPHGNKWTLKIN